MRKVLPQLTFLPRNQATVPTMIGKYSSLFLTRTSPACSTALRVGKEGKDDRRAGKRGGVGMSTVATHASREILKGFLLSWRQRHGLVRLAKGHLILI